MRKRRKRERERSARARRSGHKAMPLRRGPRMTAAHVKRREELLQEARAKGYSYNNERPGIIAARTRGGIRSRLVVASARAT